MAKLVSKAYGEALVQTANEKGRGREMLDEAIELLKIVGDNPELKVLISNPGITDEEKKGILKDVFEGRTDEEMYSFIRVLFEKGRYADLEAVLEYFIDEMKDSLGIGTAYVTTAVVLDASQRLAIEQKLRATTDFKSIEVKYSVDESLIGGMVIRIKDRVLDSSVKTRIANMEKELQKMQLG